ncbi:ABC transporter ATP-binding protein [Devosia pacifica]|uniref:Nickel import system ATP-binding protein NikD n=1 Tax=Devosia pacifica TaxID=1335967 RepID=A0A918S4L4_9HYPH|nr:ATP-binding cassette domain-containing protein [Devosia pacifica]GHA23855.1 ABC transporter ATP-binding protein [Devosia pacifica]
MSLLQIENLCLSFRHYRGLVHEAQTSVLRGIGFDVDRGEVLAVIGGSGAGKSLVAQALFGVLPGNALVSGIMRFEGVLIDKTTRPRLLGRRMALLPQSSSHLDPMANCSSQLRWAARRGGRTIRKADAQAAFLRFGLPASVGKAFPHELSGGMARRVMMAIATITEPDLLVADEPTAGLDAGNAETILSQLRAAADAGGGVILITHSLPEALKFADRVVMIENGQLVGTEAAADFTGSGASLRSHYGQALWQALPQNAFGAANA